MVSVRAIFVEKICQSLPRGGAVVIGQLPPRSPGAKTYLNIWIGQVHAKYGGNWVENEHSSGVGLVRTKIGKYQFFGDLHSGLMEQEGQWSTSTQVSET